MTNEDIAARLEAIEAVEAIKQLKARYFRFIDGKEWTAFRGLFTDDLTFYFESDDPTLRSGDEFVAFVRSRLETATTVHQGHTPEIIVTAPDTADGIWAMYDWVDDPDQHRAFKGYGHYRERYRREQDGEWHIAELRLSRIRVEPLPPTRSVGATTPGPSTGDGGESSS